MLRRLIVFLALAFVPVTALAQPLEKVTLRLDYLNGGYHAIWYLAMDRDLFKEKGIDLEVLEGRGSAATAQTVGNGSVMFGTADTGAVMGLVSQGLPVKIVGGYLR
jgi:NitT/TauT family transport system substrate-binding protein